MYIFRKFIHVNIAILFLTSMSASYALSDQPIDWKEFRGQLAFANYVLYKQNASKELMLKNYNNFKSRADKGEYFASFVIAYDYYFKKEYQLSAKYFNGISEKFSGPGDSFLAYMYANGQGVEKDFDLAIYYFQKHVRSNDELSYRAQAAYAIATTYKTKYKNSPNKILRYDSAEMREYQMSAAWLYVSNWMGNNSYYNESGFEKSLQEFLTEIESKNNSNKVRSIRTQAIGICKTISGCAVPKD